MNALSAACGAEPEGGLLELAVTLDPDDHDLGTALREYRTYRVEVEGADVFREVDRIGPPPDVFVVRSPVVAASPDDATAQVWVRAMDYGVTPPCVMASADADVTVIDGAINHLDMVLLAHHADDLTTDCP